MRTVSPTTSRRRKRRGPIPELIVLLLPLLLAGPAVARAGDDCPTPPAALKPPTQPNSCSAGTRSRGRLLHAASLPDNGCGFERLFAHRDERYGTDQLISALARAAARLAGERFAQALPDGSNPPLGVGNLSPPAHLRMQKDPFVGKRFSLSHTSGRAADLAYFVLDRKGRSAKSFETSIGYTRNGLNVSGYRRYFIPATNHNGPGRQWGCQVTDTFFGISKWKCFIAAGRYRFDDARNWALVRALLLDAEIGIVDGRTERVRPRDEGIRRLLISSPLRERLLAEARRRGEPSLLIDLAGSVLKQPSNAAPHDDHLHVDLNCAREDIGRCGCENSGVPPRPHVGRRIPFLDLTEDQRLTRNP